MNDSKYFIVFYISGMHTAIHQDVFAVDVSACVRSQQDHHAFDVVMVRHPSQRNFLTVVFEEALRLVIEQASGADTVDTYIPAGKHSGKVARQVNETGVVEEIIRRRIS